MGEQTANFFVGSGSLDSSRCTLSPGKQLVIMFVAPLASAPLRLRRACTPSCGARSGTPDPAGRARPSTGGH